jgi:hypothetical protein
MSGLGGTHVKLSVGLNNSRQDGIGIHFLVHHDVPGFVWT